MSRRERKYEPELREPIENPRIVCEVPMKIEHFHDFYFLQALKAQTAMRISANPELQFSKAVEKLENDLQEAHDDIVPNIAFRTFVYLYAACLGEARHAGEAAARQRWIPNTKKNSRSTLYVLSANYRPTPKNIQALIDIFDQEWSSGFGGKAWHNIAVALRDYGKIPDAAFIDHVIDLEHNGGTAFNKEDATYTIKFDVRYNGRLRQFLDYKFAHDILSKPYYLKLAVTRRIAGLIQRFTTIFKTKAVTWAIPALPALDEYKVNWGDEELFCEDKWFDWVPVKSGNVPTASKLLQIGGLHNIYPGALTAEELVKAANKAKAKAKKAVKVKLSKAVCDKMETYIARWIASNMPLVKVPKAKKTFPVLPCKIKWEPTGITLCVPVQSDNLGIPTEYGFKIFAATHYGIPKAAIKPNVPNYIEDGTLYEDGLLRLNYGTIIITLSDGYWQLPIKQLEALLD